MEASDKNVGRTARRRELVGQEAANRRKPRLCRQPCHWIRISESLISTGFSSREERTGKKGIKKQHLHARREGEKIGALCPRIGHVFSSRRGRGRGRPPLHWIISSSSQLHPRSINSSLVESSRDLARSTVCTIRNCIRRIELTPTPFSAFFANVYFVLISHSFG